MTKPLSNDLRVRLIDAVWQGMSCRAAAGRFGVAASTAVKLLRPRRDTGKSTPRPQGAISVLTGSRPRGGGSATGATPSISAESGLARSMMERSSCLISIG
jgi:hypothetical protein